MFIERLKKEDVNEFVRELMSKDQRLGSYYKKNVYAYIKKDKMYIAFGKEGKIDFKLEVYDTFVTCVSISRTIGNCGDISKICFKELYKIFGEEYKEYYIEQVNKIFE